jgi:hypothetical protein
MRHYNGEWTKTFTAPAPSMLAIGCEVFGRHDIALDKTTRSGIMSNEVF